MTSKRHDIGFQLLLITNRKSHMGFQLVPTLVTLNGVIARTCVISPNSIALEADYITVVEDRPYMSAECRLPLLAKIYPSCSAVSLR